MVELASWFFNRSRVPAHADTTIAILRAQQEATLDGILVIDLKGRVLTRNHRFLEIWQIPEKVAARGRNAELRPYLERLVADPDRLRASLEELDRDPRAIRSDELIHLRDGRVLSHATVPVVTAGRLRGRAFYFRDVTEAWRSEILQSALFRISELARSAPDLPTLYASIHRIVGELMDATNFYIAIHNPETDTYDFPYFVDQMDPQPVESVPVEGGLTTWVLHRGEPLLATPQVFESLIAAGEVESFGSPSVDWLGVPLTVEGRTYGVLGVQSYTEKVRYTPKDLEILMFVSHHVAGAIEHKRRLDALHASERRYRQMFEKNRAVKLLIDPESGRIVDANRSACDFYGYSLDEIRRRHVWDINILPPDRIREEMARAAAEKRTFFQFVHRISSGELRDVEVHSGPIEVGGRVLLYSIVQDVTERMQAQDALRQSEMKYRAIFDFAPVGIYQSTVDGRILTANTTLARMLGYDSVDELRERNMVTDVYLDPTARQAVIAEFAAAGRAQGIELPWKKKDGTPVWVQLNAHAVRDTDATTQYIEGFVLDVSERKAAEATLRTQAAAMNASVDGIALLDLHGRFLYVNDATSALYGYKPEQFPGASWSMLFEPREAERFRAEVRPKLREQRLWRGEATGRRNDGTLFPAEISLSMLDSGDVVCIARDVTERTYAEEQIRHLAYHDALTGLPNRLLFKDRLSVAIGRAQRENGMLGVLFLDLDRFKVINDSLGHNMGDQLLQRVAHRVAGCLRETDTVARLGGDEFTVLLPALAHADDAVLLARKILESLRAPFDIEGRELYSTTSIGISIFPDDGVDAETLIKCSDTAMYQAKELGRDTYQMFNLRINALAMGRLAVINGLRRALQNDDLAVYYQPIWNLSTGRIHGMEALVRWRDPLRGVVSPDDFIPIAESAGLMPAIGGWVMRTACAQAQKWAELGFSDLTLAVNLSVTQLQLTGFVEELLRITRETGIRPASLEVEITETSALQNPEITTLALRELKANGVRISLDDFGTGHSSLAYLRAFPIDTIKIDRSFVTDIATDRNTAAIVTGIITMARSLNLKVIAEGVEYDEQRLFLAAEGCELMQGFLFDRAMPADAFERLLIASHAPL